MDLFAISFYVFALLAIASAVVMVFSRNIVRSAFALMFSLLGIAVLYVLLYADFVAATQLLVYIGGILILILFGVMLTTQGFTARFETVAINFWPAAIFTGIVAVLLIAVFMQSDWQIIPVEDTGSTVSDLGVMLMNEYILPFQIAAILLLVAIIGAVFMASRSKKQSDKGIKQQ